MVVGILPKMIILFLVLILWLPNDAATAFDRSTTHYGKHFVFGFTAQIQEVLYSGYNEILISAPFDTYVNISLHKSRNPLLKDKYIKAGNVLKYKVSPSIRMHSTVVDTLCISVTATADVAVFCINYRRYTSDSYLALPTNGLGRKYVVASYAKSNVGIISPQDNTIVRIILNTKGTVRYNGRLYTKGQTINIKLNKLGTFHLDHRSDLSGTIVEANKPIAVLSGDKCAKIETRYCDHLVEFLLPVRNWGTKFLVATTGLMNKNAGDIFRVFSYENDTRVRSKHGDRVLKSGDFTEFDLRRELSSFFECSKPCQVVQYTKGYSNKRGKEVDSSMLVVPSINHFLNGYHVFLLGIKNNSYQHSTTILIKASERDGLLVNGKNASGFIWHNIEGTRYSWTIIQISSETAITHSSQNALFGALVFGEADFHSHGYPGGLNFLFNVSVTSSWSQWEGWSDCSVLCNGGIQTRRRTCISTNSIQDDNTQCRGKPNESRACATWKCPATCTNVPSIKNGQISGDGTQEGDIISFTCDQNYVLVGEKRLRCISSGKWNASEPKCKEMCSDPSKSTNARVIGNEFYHGKEVKFVCSDDNLLIPESSKKLTCENGKWNGSLPSCKASCPVLSKMRYGDINGSDRSHGSFIQFTCNGEYQLIGASTARCNDGSWSETVPRCLAICNKVSSIENGQVTGIGFLEGDEIRFLCNQNYVLVGEKVIGCTNTGKWNASVPKCKVICRKIPSIENGQVSEDRTLEEDTISFTCDQNYALVGEKHLRCMSNGKWNASEPKCKEKCSDPSKGTNSRVIGNEFFHGKEVEFVCTEDEILIPESSRKLNCENGKWNGSLPLCKASCPILSQIRNGVINCSDQRHGSFIQFTCNGRYKLIGASSARCNDGRWSETVPRCLATCNKVSSIENGQVTGDRFLEGDEISFLCNQNYVLVGEKLLGCTNTGRWNASEPKCKVICRKVPSFENGQVSGDGRLEEDTISFTCDQNYALVGEKYLRCMSSGKWNASEPKCEEKCSDPSKGTNARLIGNEFFRGKEVEFVCTEDYILIPESSRKLTCENGKWNGSLPSCKASCPILSKIRNGVINGGDRTHGSLILFTCNGGYQLIGVSIARCDDGQWSEKVPRCLAICNKISSIGDGHVTGSGFLEGDEIGFLCNQNYVLIGEKVLRCTNTGRWNASEPQCKETCLDPSINTNSRVIGNQFDNGKEVEFVCPRNELLIPEISRKLTCENGKWNGIIPSCKASCPHLTNISNGVINSRERTHGSFIQFVCNDGYKLFGESSVSCNDGSWSEKNPHCLAICKEISTIKNGRVVGGGSLEGEKVTFVCDKNYVIVGQRALKCTGNGKWNASEPKCEETCTDPSRNTNARVSGSEFYNGKEVEFVCPKNYVLIPKESRKLYCEKGSWKGIIPSCKASCPAMSKIPNGALNSRRRAHGSFIQFVCNGGYQLIGASNTKCNDGRWSEQLPQCIAICRKIFSIKNGKVIGSGTLEGDEIRFICNGNYLLFGENVLRCTNNGRWNVSEPKCKVPASWSRWGGWSDCTVSCNTGTKTRRRTCVGTNSILNDDQRCHGKPAETRDCATWKCPDCNKLCETGKLNGACDSCICDDNTLTGKVKNNAGVLLDNATIALIEFPYKILARTSSTGKFILNGMCISEDQIIVSRDGYIPQKIRTTKLNPTTSTVTAILKKIVFPEVTCQPESKLRLEGQPMTLCCAGTSSSGVQYEWMINDGAGDEYQHDELQSSKLIIPQMFGNMSGEIKCRVYSDYGAEFSDPANVTVFSGIDDTCDSTPSERIITLPQGCTGKDKNSPTIDVGKCHKKKCIARGLKNINDCNDNFCCQPTATKKIKIDCKRFSFDMTRVTKCGCSDGFERQTVVKGVARGGPDNIPFKYGYIYQGDKYLTRTGREGKFSFKIPGDLSRLVITFKDKRGYNNFQDLTKVIPLVPGRETYVEARMKMRPEPITFNANEGFEIPLGNSRSLGRQNSGQAVGNTDSDKESAPAVALSLPPQSLITEDGTVYNGEAKVEVIFLDPRNSTEVEEADGDFTTVNEDGEQEQLETFGVIKMDFSDVNGKRLQPNTAIDVLFDLDEYNITEKEAENVQLWYMDEKTGRWRIMDSSLKQHETRRSKRSGRRFYFSKIDPKLYNKLLNLDQLTETCLFKVKVADADVEDLKAVEVTVLATQGSLNRYSLYNVQTNIPKCIQTFCTEDHAIIRATVNGEYLVPKETGISKDVKSKHVIEYYRSAEVADRFSNRITIDKLTRPLSAQPSPFYDDINSCESSPEDYSFSFEIPKRKEVVEDLVENLGDNWYNDPELAKVCYVKIAVDNIDRCPNKTASFVVETVLGDDDIRAGYVIITLNFNKSAACAEYKCPTSDDHGVKVNVLPISAGRFTEYHKETQDFIDEMTSTVSEVFSFKPIFDLRKPSIGIIQSENEVFIADDKKGKREDCTKERIKSGIRFMCNDFPFWP